MLQSRSIRVLVVDDDLGDTYFLTKNLRLAGVEHVATLSSGEEAAKYMAGLPPSATTEIPHLIFLDLKMAGIDGIQLLNWMKKIPSFQHVPVVVFSASESAADGEAALKAGAAAFYRKIATAEGLKSIIDRSLALVNLQSATPNIDTRPRPNC